MALSCPLCSVSLAPDTLEGHLRLELSLPLLKCLLCPQSFCDERDAEAHFAGPFARHPDTPPDLICRPEKPSQTARLLELLHLARGGPDAVQQRLCVCGQCRLLCREDLRPGEPASGGIPTEGPPAEQNQPEPARKRRSETSKHSTLCQESQQLQGEGLHSDPQRTGQAATEQWLPTEVEPPDQTSEEEMPNQADVKPNLAELKPQLVTDGKVSCLQCGKREYRNTLAKHVRSAHIPGNPYQCLLCPQSAKVRASMVKHQKKDHGMKLSQNTFSESVTQQVIQDWIKLCFGELKGKGYNTYQCRPCDKPVIVNELKLHIATKHLKKTLYRCKNCDYSITNSHPGSMNNHVKKQHKVQPGPDTVDRSGMDQYAPIIKAMIPQLFQM